MRQIDTQIGDTELKKGIDELLYAVIADKDCPADIAQVRSDVQRNLSQL